jgi:hypothetical protein
LDLYYRMAKFSGAFPQRLRGQKKFFKACSGLPTHRHNYCKMLEFANKKFVKINFPYCVLYRYILYVKIVWLGQFIEWL